MTVGTPWPLAIECFAEVSNQHHYASWFGADALNLTCF